MAELADATDLKSVGVKSVPVQVRSRAPFIPYLSAAIRYRGVEQLVACRAHNPEVVWFESRLRNQNEGCLSFEATLFVFVQLKSECLISAIY